MAGQIIRQRDSSPSKSSIQKEEVETGDQSSKEESQVDEKAEFEYSDAFADELALRMRGERPPQKLPQIEQRKNTQDTSEDKQEPKKQFISRIPTIARITTP